MSITNPLPITAEQREALGHAGDEPVTVEDPETHRPYLLIRREVYERLARLAEADRVDRSLYEFGEFTPDE